ncbi:hypothetical protein [Paenibacillus sp. MSJ-34]|uniref:hypothetical protein n=1 Tax=Paenibacillus sp. MSJ-34 TaxID=2841529 RepID=UPI001C11EC38|nr:hypothetical protein [Paenibacillus sp. MSJ-34]MBU5440960.1 hypothetical protein [Paenibacillus sp. MSJ-34]
MKKIFSLLLVIACMFALSFSAFASSDFSPMAAGFGDTQDTAFPINLTPPGEHFDMSLSGPDDVDWYKWTNNTGRHKMVDLLLMKFGEGIYDVAIKIRYADGTETSKLYIEENDTVRWAPNLYIPAGATLFFVVEPKVFISPSEIYQIFLVDVELK